MFSPFHFLNLSGSFLMLMCMLFIFSLVSMSLVTISLSVKFVQFKTVLWLLMIINIMGLIPYFWCLTSYMWSNLVMALMIWGGFYAPSLFKSLNFSLAHLLPLGSPIFLWYFLISLEIISQLIRPLTLSLRLCCNLMAGHVLLSLIMNLPLISYLLLLFMLFFELAVAFIQSVVFTLLNMIYKKEVS